MNPLFLTYRKNIISFLNEYLRAEAKRYTKVNRWTKDVFKRLEPFSLSGKMWRGGLVLFTSTMAKGRPTKDAIKTAAAIELMQSALLIHDDIMDRDVLRRGMPTIWTQYDELASEQALGQTDHLGMAMGVCVGDLEFFLVFDLLSQLSPRYAARISGLVARELTQVSLAQMEDVWWGFEKKLPSKKEILAMYRYKTAGYTFSLPFVLGAILGNQSEKTVASLDTLGQLLGVIFQIKDDELRLFVDKNELGKTASSDIREGKKTLFSILLFEKVNDQEKKRLQKIFGNPQITNQDVAYVVYLLEKYGIQKRVYTSMKKYYTEAQKHIRSLSVPLSFTLFLQEFLDYNMSRTK